jgi:hypothetical protein
VRDSRYTSNAARRLQQRAIPPHVVDLLEQCWQRRAREPIGKRRLTHHLGGKRSLRLIEHWMSVYAVIGDNGKIITVGLDSLACTYSASSPVDVLSPIGLGIADYKKTKRIARFALNTRLTQLPRPSRQQIPERNIMNDTGVLPEWARARIRTNIEAVESLGGIVIREERDLYTTKWFDYRFLSPTEATNLFKLEYTKAFKIAWSQYQDRNEAEFKSGLFKMPNFRKPSRKDTTNLKREYTSIWRARQSADVLGVPYDFLIRETIEALMASGRCQTLPRPNQIAGALSDEAIRSRVKQQWRDWAALNFSSMISRLPQYMDHAYRGLHAQDAHRDWVVERLGDGHPRNVGRACYIFQTLPEDLAVAHFGEERIAQARDEVSGETPAAIAELEPGQLAPSCFAVPFAFEKNNGICLACPVRRSCETMESFARKSLRNEYGSEDPRKAKEREQANDRQRRHRAGKAALP